MSLQPDDYPRILDELQATFTSGHTRPLTWRRDQLAAVERMLRDNEERFNAALQDDLGKPEQEVLLGETALRSEERRVGTGCRCWESGTFRGRSRGLVETGTRCVSASPT